MRSRFLACFLLAGSLASSAAFSAGGEMQARRAQPRSSEDLSVRILAVHNRERAAVGVRPLQWDARLAAAAAAYATTLGSLGRLEHSARSTRPGQSENLWTGTAGRYAPEQMVGSWAAEKVRFRPGVFPNVSTTGSWEDVSHYTQMIWPATTSVGCALHRARRLDYLVCRYSPKGNQDGRRVP
jgi:hypothetical protein